MGRFLAVLLDGDGTLQRGLVAGIIAVIVALLGAQLIADEAQLPKLLAGVPPPVLMALGAAILLAAGLVAELAVRAYLSVVPLRGQFAHELPKDPLRARNRQAIQAKLAGQLEAYGSDVAAYYRGLPAEIALAAFAQSGWRSELFWRYVAFAQRDELKAWLMAKYKSVRLSNTALVTLCLGGALTLLAYAATWPSALAGVLAGLAALGLLALPVAFLDGLRERAVIQALVFLAAPQRADVRRDAAG